MPLAGGMSQIGLGINFSANDMASGPVGLLRNNFNSLLRDITSGSPRIVAGFGAITAGVSAVTAGTRGIQGAFELARSSAGFSRAVTNVGTVARASAGDLNLLEDAAIRAGLATKFSPEEATGGLRTLAQQGLNAQQSISALVPTLDFANAGQIDVAEAAEVGMGTLRAYGMSVDQLPSVYDRLMRATQMSSLGANEFITVMGRAASTGALYRQQLDSVIVALASVRSQGIPVTVATTAVGEAFRRIGSDQETQRLIQQRGVQVFDRQTGRFRDFITIMREYGEAIKDLSDEEKSRLIFQAFQVRGMQTFNAMTRIQATVTENGTERVIEGAEAQEYYMQQLRDSGGAMRDFVTRDLATFQGGLDLLRGTWQTVGVVFGRIFEKVFNPIIQNLVKIIGKFIEIWRRIPEPIQTTIGVITVVGSALLIVGGWIMTVVGVVALLGTALSGILATAAYVAAGILAAFLPIIAGVGAVIAVGYTLYEAYQQNLGGLGVFVDDIVGKITLAFAGLRQIFTQGYLSGSVLGEMLESERGVMGFVQTIGGLWEKIQLVWAGISGGFADAWGSLGPVIVELKIAFSELMNTLGSVFSIMTDGANAMPESRFQSIGMTIGQSIGGALRTGIELLTQFIRFVQDMVEIWQGAKTVLGPIFSGIFYVFYGLYRIVKMVWDVLSPVVDLLQTISNVLNPVYWLVRGLGALGESQVAAQPSMETQSWIADRRARESRESNERTENSMERPSVAERQAQTRGGGGGEIADAIRESNRRRTPVQMNIDVNLDGTQMQSVMREAEIDGQSISGGLPVTDWADF